MLRRTAFVIILLTTMVGSARGSRKDAACYIYAGETVVAEGQFQLCSDYSLVVAWVLAVPSGRVDSVSIHGHGLDAHPFVTELPLRIGDQVIVDLPDVPVKQPMRWPSLEPFDERCRHESA